MAVCWAYVGEVTRFGVLAHEFGYGLFGESLASVIGFKGYADFVLFAEIDGASWFMVELDDVPGLVWVGLQESSVLAEGWHGAVADVGFLWSLFEEIVEELPVM